MVREAHILMYTNASLGHLHVPLYFVAGLRMEIKSKVAGSEGEFEQLVVKAHFEEAKHRDLPDQTMPTKAIPKKPFNYAGTEKTP